MQLLLTDKYVNNKLHYHFILFIPVMEYRHSSVINDTLTVFCSLGKYFYIL